MYALYTPSNGDIYLHLTSEEIKQITELKCKVVTETNDMYYLSDLAMVIDNTRTLMFDGVDCEWDIIGNTELQAPSKISLSSEFIARLQHHKQEMIRMGNELIDIRVDNADRLGLLDMFLNNALVKLKTS